MVGSSFKIGIDVDGTITSAPEFFRTLTRNLRFVAEIHILTARSFPGDKDFDHILKVTEEELGQLGIYYDALALRTDKARYIVEHSLNVMFENTDAEIESIPESCLCFKIRESENFDWETKKWYQYDDSQQPD